MMRKRCSLRVAAFFCVKNNLSGIGKKNGYSETRFENLVLRVIFGDFTKSDLENAGKEGDGDGDERKCKRFL